MTLQDDFTAAGQEYARRLEKQRETDRLATLVHEARREGNASAFALALEEAFAKSTDHTDTTTEEN